MGQRAAFATVSTLVSGVSAGYEKLGSREIQTVAVKAGARETR